MGFKGFTRLGKFRNPIDKDARKIFPGITSLYRVREGFWRLADFTVSTFLNYQERKIVVWGNMPEGKWQCLSLFPREYFHLCFVEGRSDKVCF